MTSHDQLEALRADPLLQLFSHHKGTALPAPVSSDRHQAGLAGPAPLHTQSHTQSAASILTQKQQHPRFSSGSNALDSLLYASEDPGSADGSGLERGRLLEISGCPGEGKTRTVVSFAANAAVAVATASASAFACDGKGKGKDTSAERPARVLVIDTQGSIPLRSLRQAVHELCANEHHIKLVALQSIILWPCSDPHDFLAALYGLPRWLDAHPSVELILIDSLTAPLLAYIVPALSTQLFAAYEANSKSSYHASAKKRQRRSNSASSDSAHGLIRQLLYGTVKEVLLDVTASRNIAVVITTQSKTKLTDEFGENASFKNAKHSFAVPQYTNFWHVPYTTQIILSAGPSGIRTATLTATASSQRGKSAVFKTTASGIADLEE